MQQCLLEGLRGHLRPLKNRVLADKSPQDPTIKNLWHLSLVQQNQEQPSWSNCSRESVFPCKRLFSRVSTHLHVQMGRAGAAWE